jgi:hypothetical protein
MGNSPTIEVANNNTFINLKFINYKISLINHLNNIKRCGYFCLPSDSDGKNSIY